MWKIDLRIELDEEERQELERLARSQVAPHRAVVRARTILLLAAGMPVSAVACQVGRGRRIVRKWGVRFQRMGCWTCIAAADHRVFPPEVAAYLQPSHILHSIEQTLGNIIVLAFQRRLVPGPLSRVPSSLFNSFDSSFHTLISTGEPPSCEREPPPRTRHRTKS
jgi:hypothetical protein